MIKYLVAVFLVLASFAVTMGQTPSGEDRDSVEVVSVDYEAICHSLTARNDSLMRANAQLSEDCKANERLIRRMSVENENRLRTYADSAASLRLTVRTLKDANQLRRDSIDQFQKQMVVIASNFLYIPYEQYSIEEIAVPAFEQATGSKYYANNRIRLELLKNYKNDIATLKRFMDDTDRKVWNERSDVMKESMVPEQLSELKCAPFYLRYRQYDDWRETWLGKIILKLENELSHPGENASADWQKIKEEISNVL